MSRKFSGTGPLDYANFPQIEILTTAFVVSGDFNLFMGLEFHGSIIGDDIVEIASGAKGCVMYRCRVEQQSTTTTNATRCVNEAGQFSCIFDCDFKTSAAAWYSTSSNGIVYQSTSQTSPLTYCRFEINNNTTSSRGKGPSCRYGAFGCTIDGLAKGSGFYDTSGYAMWLGNTVYGHGDTVFRAFYGNFNLVGIHWFADNHVTDCGYFIQNGAGTPTTLYLLTNNRTRDIATSFITGNADAALEKLVGNVETTGAASDDYEDHANGDFRLKTTAAGHTKGTFSQDIGSFYPPQSSAGGSTGGPGMFRVVSGRARSRRR